MGRIIRPNERVIPETMNRHATRREVVNASTNIGKSVYDQIAQEHAAKLQEMEDYLVDVTAQMIVDAIKAERAHQRNRAWHRRLRRWFVALDAQLSERFERFLLELGLRDPIEFDWLPDDGPDEKSLEELKTEMGAAIERSPSAARS